MARKLIILAVVLILISALTVFFNRNIENRFLLYALLPGIIVNLLITGGHGGTSLEEAVGLIANVAVNSMIYTGIIFLLLRLKRSSKPT